MSTYAIGDVQGCFDELQALLALINYDANKDQLWFCGDLVNRGPASLQTLRFIKSLPNCRVVLGNHDLHLLALAYTASHHHPHTLEDILTAPDREELLDWLRRCPLLYFDSRLNAALVHAGIPPQWSLQQALTYAQEVEHILSGHRYKEFLQHMYGNLPAQWNECLIGWDRPRCIVNYLTRMRFCDAQGRLELLYKGQVGGQPAGYLPWFEWPNPFIHQERLVFGHWAALNGEVHVPNIYALDTGCVWGGRLTALRLEDNERFCIQCST